MVIGITRLVPVTRAPLPRLWLVFFGEAASRPWWGRFFRPGFRHVRAAAWFDQTSRWMLFDPTIRGIHIEIETDEAFAARWAELYGSSAAILRMRSEYGRGALPPAFWCVGAVKALLGIRSCALLPHGLYRDLLAQGAEIVRAPSCEADIGRPLRHPENSAATAGRPCDQGSA